MVRTPLLPMGRPSGAAMCAPCGVITLGLLALACSTTEECALGIARDEVFQFTIVGPEVPRGTQCSPVPVNLAIGTTFTLTAGDPFGLDDCPSRTAKPVVPEPFADVVEQCYSGENYTLGLDCTFRTESACPAGVRLYAIADIRPRDDVIENALFYEGWDAPEETCPDFNCHHEYYLVRVERLGVP
jgi:hypothetical protein